MDLFNDIDVPAVRPTRSKFRVAILSSLFAIAYVASGCGQSPLPPSDPSIDSGTPSNDAGTGSDTDAEILWDHGTNNESDGNTGLGPFEIDAGPDREITLPALVWLKGRISSPFSPSSEWSLVSGPEAVSFEDASNLTTAVQFSAAGDYVFQLRVSATGGVETDELSVTVKLARPLAFSDITQTAGIAGPTAMGKTGGHGAMFGDVDRDGATDLYITMINKTPMPDLFFHYNANNAYTQESQTSGLIGPTDAGNHGFAFADFDNDGDFDAVRGITYDKGTTASSGSNQVLQNNGSGLFTDRTNKSVEMLQTKNPTRATLAFDADGDGDLDIFTVSGAYGDADSATEKNEFYLNQGAFTFKAAAGGDAATAAIGQGAVDTDFDNDGDIDIIAANRTGPVRYLQNNGKGIFKVLGASALGFGHQAKDGISVGDVNNDGLMDVLLCGDNEAHLYIATSTQYVHRRSFDNTDGYMGGFADLDNDGDLDLAFAGSAPIFLNDGTGNFQQGPSPALDNINDPRAIAFADIDNDGDLDFAIAAKNSGNRLVRNELNSGNWLRVKLISPQGQSGAFGARLKIYMAGDVKGKMLAQREARSNQGYLAQNDPRIHFGLGDNGAVDLKVTFPTGETVIQQFVSANQTIVVDGRSKK